MASNLKVPFDLYLITDRGVVGDRDLIEVVEQALRGGVKAIQLRDKGLAGRSLFELALKFREVTSKYNAQLLINDRVDIAMAARADGVHLPSDGMTVKDARALLGSGKLIGLSCHSKEDVEKAETDGADFATVGPIYDTPSKREYGEPLGEGILNELRKCAIKVFALGGVKIEKIEECISSGADGVAMISGILSSKDVEKTTIEYIKKIKNQKYKKLK